MKDMKPAEIARALATGAIDAGLTWDPFIYRAEVELGDNAVVLPNQDGQFFYFMLIGKTDWIDEHAEAARGVLRALLRAEEFAINNTERAKELIGRLFDYDKAYLDHLWPLHSLHVALPQDLLFVLETAANWRIRNGLSDRASSPDYMKFLALQPLRTVRRSAVGIVE